MIRISKLIKTKDRQRRSTVAVAPSVQAGLSFDHSEHSVTIPIKTAKGTYLIELPLLLVLYAADFGVDCERDNIRKHQKRRRK